jgi:hypothetical protein
VQDIDRNELTAKLLVHKQLLEWNGQGYRAWRYNFLDNTVRDFKPRWTEHPEEYATRPVNTIWK